MTFALFKKNGDSKACNKVTVTVATENNPSSLPAGRQRLACRQWGHCFRVAARVPPPVSSPLDTQRIIITTACSVELESTTPIKLLSRWYHQYQPKTYSHGHRKYSAFTTRPTLADLVFLRDRKLVPLCRLLPQLLLWVLLSRVHKIKALFQNKANAQAWHKHLCTGTST